VSLDIFALELAMDSEPIGTIQPVEPARIHIREGFYDDMGDSLS